MGTPAIDKSLSIVIATHNRRDTVLATLQKLYALGDETRNSEIIVVDNASTDATAQAIRHRYKDVTLITLNQNRGSCAKAYGADRASGSLLLFLDDDSYPRPGAIGRMIEHFADDPKLGAAGFTIHLSDGGHESSALRNVFVGCGVGLRRQALNACGGLDRDLFMQAEEYDLCFRLAAHGWRTANFDDLHVDHEKSPHSRSSARRAYLDTYNNMLVAARYIPDRWFPRILDDWTTRYRWLCTTKNQRDAVDRAVADGRQQRHTDRLRFATHRLTPADFERYFAYAAIDHSFKHLADNGIHRVILAGLGKNIFPFVCGAARNGITINAIADNLFASANRTYQSIPIVPCEEAVHTGFEAVIVSNTSPAHASTTARRWQELSAEPVFLFDAARPAEFIRLASRSLQHAT